MDKYTKITNNFIWYEFWSNNFGKPKVEPPAEYLPNIIHVATQLQKVRDQLNKDKSYYVPEIKILITSAYRTLEWNSSKNVEGAKASLHLTGSAGDSRALGVPLMLFWSYILRYTDLNELGFYKDMNFVHAGIYKKLRIFKY